MPALIELLSVSAAYGRIQALSEVSLKVEEGKVVALLGSNGAGKTTLLNVISRVVPESAGKVMVANSDVGRWASHQMVAAGIVQVPEGREIFPDMSVTENLKLGAYRRADKGSLREDYDRVMESFPVLAERSRQRAGTLSGGEQQMLMIGRALMAKPRAILFDEPSLGLSPRLVQQTFEIIRKLNQDGLTILLVEQNASVALAASTYTYILENGEIVLEGASQSLEADDGVRRSYLGG